MKKLIIIGIIFASVISVQAQSRFSTDSFGNTRGTIDGESYRSHTDSFGNTRGTIGGKFFSCYTDSFGNTRCN